MVKIQFASLDDTQDIMRFMHEVWREDHILSKHKELFLYEFQHGNSLNFAIARNDYGRLVGLFGYIFYNQGNNPDIGGSLWKVVDSEKTPLLGLKLRNYVISNVPHRFFAAPGAGLQTRSIYDFLKMNWHTMQHFYCINEAIPHHLIQGSKEKLIIGDNTNRILGVDGRLHIENVDTVEGLQEFPFDSFSHIAPFKDFSYLRKRFFEHPIYKYDVYLIQLNNSCINIVVCRQVSFRGNKAYRIVDFYGETDYLSDILIYLKGVMIARQYEYIDFVCHGFMRDHFVKAGFCQLDFDQNNTIVPNYYEPFLLKNVPVYCVSDQTALSFRQCKADGDQDRPNFFE